MTSQEAAQIKPGDIIQTRQPLDKGLVRIFVVEDARWDEKERKFFLKIRLPEDGPEEAHPFMLPEHELYWLDIPLRKE